MFIAVVAVVVVFVCYWCKENAFCDRCTKAALPIKTSKGICNMVVCVVVLATWYLIVATAAAAVDIVVEANATSTNQQLCICWKLWACYSLRCTFFLFFLFFSLMKIAFSVFVEGWLFLNWLRMQCRNGCKPYVLSSQFQIPKHKRA